MLTKSLVRYSLRRGVIKPQFVKRDDPAVLGLAEELIAVFVDGAGRARDALLADTETIIESSRCDLTLARGFEKLLLDRADFESPDDEERPQLRRTVFARVSQLLAAEPMETIDAFETFVSQAFGQSRESLAARLYSDLPGQQPLIAFEPISAERFLNRYNLALVQWLVAQSHGLELTVWDAEPAQLRQLFKYLRFHQLLAQVERAGGTGWLLRVDGPLSLFQQTKKYAMQLANFTPAILLLPKWRLCAEATVKNRRKGELQLDHDCGLRAEPERFHAYVPQEMTVFRESLRAKLPEWRVEDGGHLRLPGDRYCFPDFTLVHEGAGRTVAVELFHPWHAAHLPQRLAQLAEGNDAPLILGVDTRLAKKAETAATLAESAYFSDFGFQFRDLPTPGKLAPILQRLLADKKKAGR